jgi:hypothetical protein
MPTGKNYIAGKTQTGAKVMCASITIIQYLIIFILLLNDPNQLQYWRLPTWLKFQKFKFILENPSNICVPSNISVPSSTTEPVRLSGQKRKIRELLLEEEVVVVCSVSRDIRARSRQTSYARTSRTIIFIGHLVEEEMHPKIMMN